MFSLPSNKRIIITKIHINNMSIYYGIVSEKNKKLFIDYFYDNGKII